MKPENVKREEACRICAAGPAAYRMADGCTQANYEEHKTCFLCHPAASPGATK